MDIPFRGMMAVLMLQFGLVSKQTIGHEVWCYCVLWNSKDLNVLLYRMMVRYLRWVMQVRTYVQCVYPC